MTTRKIVACCAAAMTAVAAFGDRPVTQQALETLKPEDYADVEKFEAYRAALTAEEVTEIVNLMRETVDFTPDNGPIDTILVWIGKFVSVLTKMTGGKFSDFQGLALFLNDSIKKSNEELEEIEMAVTVAESEQVIASSASATAAALADAGNITKDEDKYNALMQEIGMPIA